MGKITELYIPNTNKNFTQQNKELEREVPASLPTLN